MELPYTDDDYGFVSVIMPVHNCSAYIEQTIRSVQAQTYRHWYLLVQDDCSDDDTAAIVQGLSQTDSRIQYERNPVRVGTAASRNKALQRVQSRWVAFLDGDDTWQPCKLEHQLRFMMQHGYSFTYTAYSLMDAQSQPMHIRVSGPKHVTHKMLLYCNWFGCLTVMYDASNLGFVQAEPLWRNNDYALWIALSRETDCHLLDEELASYRKRESNFVHAAGIREKVYWHFQVMRLAAGMNIVHAGWMTLMWIGCGLFKKWRYEQRER